MHVHYLRYLFLRTPPWIKYQGNWCTERFCKLSGHTAVVEVTECGYRHSPSNLHDPATLACGGFHFIRPSLQSWAKALASKSTWCCWIHFFGWQLHRQESQNQDTWLYDDLLLNKTTKTHRAIFIFIWFLNWQVAFS